MYLSVAIIGYSTYGDQTEPSIITSLKVPWMRHTANMLITLHVMCIFPVGTNPLNQELEEIFQSSPQQYKLNEFILYILQ